MASAHLNSFSRALGLVVSIAALVLTAGAAWSAPEKVAGGIKFTYRDPNASTVCWAGEFNSWSATANPMKKDDKGVWNVVINLPAGEQTYKFVVDGQWFADPENPVTKGEYGNSVLKVGADGGLQAQTATSNTAYNPKITIGGRTHSLFEEIFDSNRSRYELSRPLFDIDLGFGIRVSDLMTANILTNIDPQKEDVQDYRSRLNWKRGSIEFNQRDLRIFAFDSETLPDWDDPAHLVGNIGVYHHPFGYQQNGFMVATPKYGFETQVIYSDNSTPGGTEFPAGNGDVFDDFKVNRGTNRVFDFDNNAVNHTWQLMKTTRTPSNDFVLVPGQVSVISATDIGDGGASFGYGDGATNVFAASVRRMLPGGLRLGVLGRTNRGYHLGRIVFAKAIDDSNGTITFGQTQQQWFAGGGELRWTPRPNWSVHAEYLQGARRLDLMDRASLAHFKVTSMNAANPSAATLTYDANPPIGQHYNIDESGRFIVGADWVFAQSDVGLHAEYEHQSHRYPSWFQPPVGPPASTNLDVQQFENVQFLRGVTLDPKMLDNTMDELRLRWDRNWRYYLGREVKTVVDAEFTHFDYDPMTSWQYQMWFPTGNFWLEQNGQVVGLDRLTSLGYSHVYRLRPAIEVPIRAARNVVFRWKGTFTGTPPGFKHLALKQPRYSESIFQLGADVTPRLRFENDTRWAKYDAPVLGLASGYLSQFSELTYKFSDDIRVAVGFGVDPTALDPVTNEFAYVGRESYLAQLNANGYIAESNYMSLAPQIAAAESRLQRLNRIQFEAVVRF